MSKKNFEMAQQWIDSKAKIHRSHVGRCLREIAARCKEKRVLTHNEHCDLVIWALEKYANKGK